MKLLRYIVRYDRGPRIRTSAYVPGAMHAESYERETRTGRLILGHAPRKGNRLVYAMRITNVLDMNDYFDQFPSKRPDPAGTFEQRRGDNIYYSRDGQWRRAPSLEHNTVENFRQDCGRTVYLAEGAENYWYFGAEGALQAQQEFPSRFPRLVHAGRGISYATDPRVIAGFAAWLESLGRSGLIGEPGDRALLPDSDYLVAIDPDEQWMRVEDAGEPRRSPVLRHRQEKKRKALRYLLSADGPGSVARVDHDRK